MYARYCAFFVARLSMKQWDGTRRNRRMRQRVIARATFSKSMDSTTSDMRIISWMSATALNGSMPPLLSTKMRRESVGSARSRSSSSLESAGSRRATMMVASSRPNACTPLSGCVDRAMTCSTIFSAAAFSSITSSVCVLKRCTMMFWMRRMQRRQWSMGCTASCVLVDSVSCELCAGDARPRCMALEIFERTCWPTRRSGSALDPGRETAAGAASSPEFELEWRVSVPRQSVRSDGMSRVTTPALTRRVTNGASTCSAGGMSARNTSRSRVPAVLRCCSSFRDWAEKTPSGRHSEEAGEKNLSTSVEHTAASSAPISWI
mmetsp:Transcript_3146/g.7672  ORF Transcript_3146/g.7672 Transcript_3146/m.7672 type:complete len:320 (-) Transcript_3146:164-1123(-)